MMKTYSEKTKIISTTIGILISYLLIILKNNYLSEKIDSFEDGTFSLYLEFGVSLLCICIPIIIVVSVFQIEYRYLLIGLPLIFLLVLIYSPEGWYFILYKGAMYLNPAEDNWVYGITISPMFYIIQLITACIIKELRN